MSDLASVTERVADHTAERLDTDSDAWGTGVAALGLLHLDRHEAAVTEAVDRAVATQTSEGLLAYGWGDYPKDWMRWVEDDMSSYKPTINTSILARAAVELYERQGNETYLDALRRLFEFYRDGPRTVDGGIIRRLDEREIFTETLHFVTPYFVRFGQLIEDDAPIEDALRQVDVHTDRLQDPHTGLFRHIWREVPNSYPLSVFWSRANGWAVAGLLDTLLDLPGDHAGRDAMVERLDRALDTIVDLQDGSGFWHMALDDPNSPLETSGTAIFAYTLKRALAEGIVDDDRYGPVAEAGMKACTGVVSESGEVRRVSKPPASATSPLGVTRYGQGWFLLAANEFL